jgi:hypothetical protein
MQRRLSESEFVWAKTRSGGRPMPRQKIEETSPVRAAAERNTRNAACARDEGEQTTGTAPPPRAANVSNGGGCRQQRNAASWDLPVFLSTHPTAGIATTQHISPAPRLDVST